MFNLMKMDFYRLFRSKALRIGAIVAACIAFIGMLFNLGIIELIKFTGPVDEEVILTMGMLFPVLGWMQGVDFADIVLSGTNTLSLFVGCIVVASFIGAEQSCGYVKNIAGQLPHRGMAILSKYIVTCFVYLMILLVYTAVSAICAGWFFGAYINAYSIGEMVAGLALRLLLFCAVNAVLVFCCTLMKSHAIAMVVGTILGIGVMNFVYKGITLLLGLMKITLDVERLMPDGVNGLICVANVGSIAVRAVIISIVFIAAFVGGAMLLFQKRDVK